MTDEFAKLVKFRLTARYRSVNEWAKAADVNPNMVYKILKGKVGENGADGTRRIISKMESETGLSILPEVVKMNCANV